MKTALFVFGILFALLGVWWILQGTGIAPVGFMANQMPWAYRGMALAVLGGVMIVFSRR